jgi:predicted transglutaminase-like protease
MHMRGVRRQSKENKAERARWWKAITLYKVYIFITLLIYIGIANTSNVVSFWDKSRNTIHKLMEPITLFRFQQIKRYFHMSPPITT